MKLPAAALTVLLLTAGCSAGASGPDLNTMQGIRDALAAKQLPCEGYQQRPEVVFAKEEGSCTIGSEEVTIILYQNAEQRAQIDEAFAAFQTGYRVNGQHPWQINTKTSDLAGKVAAALGGKVA